MTEKKHYKIAKIIDETSFIINAGSKDGIKEGTQFTILDGNPEVVKDPDTGEVIGEIGTHKGLLFAQIVYSNMTLAHSKQVNVLQGIAGNPLLRYTELNVDQSQITGGFTNSRNPIQIGDVVTKDN